MTEETRNYSIFQTDVRKTTEGEGPFLEELKSALWKKRALDPEGVYRSNLSGTWHSKDDVLSTCGPAATTLADMLFREFKSYAGNFVSETGGSIELRLTAWCMMYDKGGYATVHTHPNCHFSGVYYVDVGPEVEDAVMATGVSVKPGSIEFVDTRGTGSLQVPGLNLSSAARFAPKNGEMLIFPSWLPHFVHPIATDYTRIAIACNASILRYTPPKKE